MKPWKAGTKCVITWAVPNDETRVGEVYEVGPLAHRAGEIVQSNGRCRRVPKGPVKLIRDSQQIEAFDDGSYTIYPIAWMRPIDKDTGPDDEEVIREYSTVRHQRAAPEAPARRRHRRADVR